MKPFDPKAESEHIVSFLRTTFQTNGFTKAVIGLSGGVDSATSCSLAVQALGKEHVYVVLMPYGTLSTQGTLDAMSYATGLGLPISNILRVDIKPTVDGLSSQLFSPDEIRRGNIMARVRMTILFDQAKRRQALVVGTENKSEHLLGYFTRFGDEASDIEPLRHLYKTQVYAMAKYLNVPEIILSKAPSADLWFDQTDEKEFGFTYKDADEIMSLLYDEKKTIDEIVAQGLDITLVEKVKRRVNQNAFKHSLPHVI